MKPSEIRALSIEELRQKEMDLRKELVQPQVSDFPRVNYRIIAECAQCART